MPDPVVITRPLAQAHDLAAQVRALGREAVVFPLLEISALPDDSGLRAVLANLHSYAMVVFVSPNAIDAAFRIIDAWPAEVAIAVVGEGSRRALERHGVNDANARIFRPRDPFRSDSETLLEVLDLEILRDKTVLVVRGESGRELLTNALRGVGASVEQVAAYRRSAPLLNEVRREQLQALLSDDSTWVVTSSEALRNLLDMVDAVAGKPGVARLQQQRMIIPHVRIAEMARTLEFEHITLTGSGDESVIAALQCSP